MSRLDLKYMDLSLKHPILVDFFLMIIVYLLSTFVKVIPFNLSDHTNQINILSHLIGSTITLSGFILAAFTIIVTFKSSLAFKGIEESSDGITMLFESRFYKQIVDVFKKSIAELVSIALILYCFWASGDNISIKTINMINTITIVLIMSIVHRSLYTLFSVVSLSLKK